MQGGPPLKHLAPGQGSQPGAPWPLTPQQQPLQKPQQQQNAMQFQHQPQPPQHAPNMQMQMQHPTMQVLHDSYCGLYPNFPGTGVLRPRFHCCSTAHEGSIPEYPIVGLA